MALTGNVLVNGIHWKSRRLLLAPAPAAEFVADLRTALGERKELATHALALREVRGLRPEFHAPDLSDPKQAGWALLVHAADRAELAAVFKELVARRNGAEFVVGAGETDEVVLNRWQSLDQRPYYVLIAAPPERVSFKLQSFLNCAAGRVWFDTRQEFETYVKGVLDAEQNDDALPAGRAVFLATDRDDVTMLSSQSLAAPLRDLVQAEGLDTAWLGGCDATVGRLQETLAERHESRGSALLFTATHGAAFDRDDPDQRQLQGALVCNDDLFGAGQVCGEASLAAGIAFFFACYGAGTPSTSDFSLWCPGRNDELLRAEAQRDFLAALPQKLLGSARPALAVIAHLDPAWLHSFVDTQSWKERLGPYQEALRCLMRGAPVGYAMREFTELCGRYNSYLLNLQIRFAQANLQGKAPEPVLDENLFDTWILRTDAQNFLILGDPAVRLAHA